MQVINEVVTFILSFKAYVMLPLIILLFALVFGLKPGKAIQSALTIGIGFIGIFMVFDYFIERLGPSVEALIQKTGLQFHVLDVGWTPLAAITWSFQLAPILIILCMAVNMIMLVCKQTRTVNIDIWNLWHFIFVGQMVYTVTASIWLSIASAVLTSVLFIKLADWSAQSVKEFSGLDGVSITTLSAAAYYPVGIVGNQILDRIPVINKLNADAEGLKKKLGLLGEPMVIGFIMGVLLGIGAGFPVKNILELGFEIAAVIYILPMMSGILAKGLMPISDGMKAFIAKRFPNIGETYIGLDIAVLIGSPSIIVTGLLLMPVALVLAFILPGISFIPLGDLANIMCPVAMIVVATKGNVVRSFLLGIPLIIGHLYAASYMAPTYTALAQQSGFELKGYEGMITSFLDGGNIMRTWLIELFQGRTWALVLLPVVGLVLYGSVRWEQKKRINLSVSKESQYEIS